MAGKIEQYRLKQPMPILFMKAKKARRKGNYLQTQEGVDYLTARTRWFEKLMGVIK